MVYYICAHFVFWPQIGLRKSEQQVWHPLKTFTAYIIAWYETCWMVIRDYRWPAHTRMHHTHMHHTHTHSRCLPMVFLMFVFGTIALLTNIVSDASDCSCFCLPVFGNVLPYAFPRDWVSVQIINCYDMIRYEMLCHDVSILWYIVTALIIIIVSSLVPSPLPAFCTKAGKEPAMWMRLIVSTLYQIPQVFTKMW